MQRQRWGTTGVLITTWESFWLVRSFWQMAACRICKRNIIKKFELLRWKEVALPKSVGSMRCHGSFLGGSQTMVIQAKRSLENGKLSQRCPQRLQYWIFSEQTTGPAVFE